MSEVEVHIEEWIKKISSIRPELGNFSVCPFASEAKYKIIETLAEDIVPISGYDVVFFVVEDYFDLKSVEFWTNFYNKLFPEYIFLEDHASYDTFINGVQSNNGKYNLILMQNREKLRNHRKILVNLGYYSHWNDEFLKEILGDDIDLLDK